MKYKIGLPILGLCFWGLLIFILASIGVNIDYLIIATIAVVIALFVEIK